MKAPNIDAEVALLEALRRHGIRMPDPFAGDTTLGVRRELFRSAIVSIHLEAVLVPGKAITFGEQFARLYGEPIDHRGNQQCLR